MSNLGQYHFCRLSNEKEARREPAKRLRRCAAFRQMPPPKKGFTEEIPQDKRLSRMDDVLIKLFGPGAVMAHAGLRGPAGRLAGGEQRFQSNTLAEAGMSREAYVNGL